MKEKLYNAAFYRSISSPSRVAAEHILPHLDQAIRPSSIVDVGCGSGAWLEVWHRKLGKPMEEILGIDGAHVNPAQLLIPKERFKALDVGQSFDLGRKFGLAMSLEVGEHLEPAQSRTFVQNIARLSDHVVFSAAPPGQGGRNHINEKPYQFWKELFEAEGFLAFDFVRPHAMQFTEIAPWYRYNPILFVRESAVGKLPESVRKTLIPKGERVRDLSPIAWRGRKLLLSQVPTPVLSALSDLKHRASQIFK